MREKAGFIVAWGATRTNMSVSRVAGLSRRVGVVPRYFFLGEIGERHAELVAVLQLPGQPQGEAFTGPVVDASADPQPEGVVETVVGNVIGMEGGVAERLEAARPDVAWTPRIGATPTESLSETRRE